jgi:hypothetical protein
MALFLIRTLSMKRPECIMSSSGRDEQWGFGGVSPKTKKEPESIMLVQPPSKWVAY